LDNILWLRAAYEYLGRQVIEIGKRSKQENPVDERRKKVKGKKCPGYEIDDHHEQKARRPHLRSPESDKRKKKVDTKRNEYGGKKKKNKDRASLRSDKGYRQKSHDEIELNEAKRDIHELVYRIDGRIIGKNGEWFKKDIHDPSALYLVGKIGGACT